MQIFSLRKKFKQGYDTLIFRFAREKSRGSCSKSPRRMCLDFSLVLFLLPYMVQEMSDKTIYQCHYISTIKKIKLQYNIILQTTNYKLQTTNYLGSTNYAYSSSLNSSSKTIFFVSSLNLPTTSSSIL